MTNLGQLQLYARVPRTMALGPGLRYGLWVQGCPFRCPGCMTPGALDVTGGEAVPISSLAEEILALDDLEGLSLSGGEPFTQAAGLAILMQQLREQRDLGLIVYTGYRLPALQALANRDPGVAALLGATDLLIDGPYLAEHNDDTPLRGSSNQGLHLLTDRYRAHLGAYDSNQTRQIELHVGIREHLLVGIPSVRQLAWWQSRHADCNDKL